MKSDQQFITKKLGHQLWQTRGKLFMVIQELWSYSYLRIVMCKQKTKGIKWNQSQPEHQSHLLSFGHTIKTILHTVIKKGTSREVWVVAACLPLLLYCSATLSMSQVAHLLKAALSAILILSYRPMSRFFLLVHSLHTPICTGYTKPFLLTFTHPYQNNA